MRACEPVRLSLCSMADFEGISLDVEDDDNAGPPKKSLAEVRAAVSKRKEADQLRRRAAADKSPQPVREEPFVHITSKLSGFVLEVGAGSGTSTFSVQLGCREEDALSQLWRHSPEGHLESALGSGLVLGTTIGSRICVQPKQAAPHQEAILWEFTQRGSMGELVNRASGVLTIRGGDKTVHADLRLTKKKNSRAQAWSFDSACEASGGAPHRTTCSGTLCEALKGYRFVQRPRTAGAWKRVHIQRRFFRPSEHSCTSHL